MEYNCLNLLYRQRRQYYDIILALIAILVFELQSKLFSVFLVASRPPESIHVLRAFIVLASSPDGIPCSVIRDILVFIFDILLALPHNVYIIFPIRLGRPNQPPSSAN